MKLKFIIFSILLLCLTALADNGTAKSEKKSNWKSFSLPDQTSRQSKMLVGWNGSRLVVKLKPQAGEGGYSLAKRVLVPEYRSLKTIRKYSKTRSLYQHRYITFRLRLLMEISAVQLSSPHFSMIKLQINTGSTMLLITGKQPA